MGWYIAGLVIVFIAGLMAGSSKDQHYYDEGYKDGRGGRGPRSIGGWM